jgi:hypothetical protein
MGMIESKRSSLIIEALLGKIEALEGEASSLRRDLLGGQEKIGYFLDPSSSQDVNGFLLRKFGERLLQDLVRGEIPLPKGAVCYSRDTLSLCDGLSNNPRLLITPVDKTGKSLAPVSFRIGYMISSELAPHVKSKPRSKKQAKSLSVPVLDGGGIPASDG